MKPRDQIRRFLFERDPIRGQHVTLNSCWRQIAEQSEAAGDIAESCEFCNASYAYDAVDLALLFNDAEFQSISPTRH